MTDKRKSWWSELSKGDDHVEREWIQWIELVAGLSAMIVLTLSLLAVWESHHNCLHEGTMNQRLLVLPHGISRHLLRVDRAAGRAPAAHGVIRASGHVEL